MKFSKTFKIVREQVPGSSSFESFIYFENLFSVLTKTEKGLRRFNFKRSLQKYKGGITSINGKDAIPVISVLQYCFVHIDTLQACKKLVLQIQKEVVCDSSEGKEDCPSSFELYKLVSKTRFHDADILFETLSINQ